MGPTGIMTGGSHAEWPCRIGRRAVATTPRLVPGPMPEKMQTCLWFSHLPTGQAVLPGHGGSAGPRGRARPVGIGLHGVNRTESEGA
jgi:hypothetical protein